MKRKSMLRNSHTLLSLTLVTVSLMTVGYSSWVITSGSDGVSYGSGDGNVSSELTNSGKEVTLNFDDTVDASAFDVPTTNSYYSPKVEATLDYTENESYPLKDNFEMFDETNPYGGVADSDRNIFRHYFQYGEPLRLVRKRDCFFMDKLLNDLHRRLCRVDDGQ